MKTQINMNELLEDLDNGAEINEALTAKEITELKELDVREIAEALAKEELEEVDFDSLEAALETAFERDDEGNPCLDPCITIDVRQRMTLGGASCIGIGLLIEVTGQRRGDHGFGRVCHPQMTQISAELYGWVLSVPASLRDDSSG